MKKSQDFDRSECFLRFEIGDISMWGWCDLNKPGLKNRSSCHQQEVKQKERLCRTSDVFINLNHNLSLEQRSRIQSLHTEKDGPDVWV